MEQQRDQVLGDTPEKLEEDDGSDESDDNGEASFFCAIYVSVAGSR
jgi:hypothetical protein